MKKVKAAKATVVNSASISGEVIQSYGCDFNSYSNTNVYLVLVDSKYVSSEDGLYGHLTGAVVYDSITVCAPKKVTVIPEGSVIVFLSKKTQSRFNYSKKQLAILTAYEAAKAFYCDKNVSPVKTNLDNEECAIAWLASLAAEAGYWRATVFSTLEKYDKKVRHFEKKYFSKVKKAARTTAVLESPEVQAEVAQVLNALTT